MSRYNKLPKNGAWWLPIALILMTARSTAGVPQARAAAEGVAGYSRNLTVSGVGGTLTSPNYPSPYPSSVECRWLLTAAEPGATIKLNIADLSLEQDTHCRLDYLQVYLGATTLSPALGRFCGALSNKLLLTNASTVLLLFRSDPVYEDRGFSLDYFTQAYTGCVPLLTALSGSLTSPRFPDNYPDHTDCWTVINVGKGKRITLIFDSVDMEYGDKCTVDYVQIFDGETRNSTLLGQICQQSDVRSYESSSGSLLVHFHSDDSVAKRGYRATYSSVDARSSPKGKCLWEPGESSGVVASPGYPSNYPSFSNCSLWILGPGGSTVLLSIDAMQLEMDPQCSFDYLQIEEPAPKGVRVLGRLCGNDDEPKNLTSTGNEVHLRFQSDDFGEFSGFRLYYSFLIKDRKKIANESETSVLSFREVPRNATLKLGSSHMLHCTTHHAGATIRWLKNGIPLAGGSPMAGLRLLPNSTLWIQSMDHPLSGAYTCVATTRKKNITAQAYILVQSSDDEICDIVFLKTPHDSWYSEGELAHLECLAAGRQVRVSWEKDDRPLVVGGRVTAIMNRPQGHVFVERVQAADVGIYTCVARDDEVGCEKRAAALLQISPRINEDDVCGIPKVALPPEGIPSHDHGKITGGQDAKEGAYPWHAMLWEPSLGAFCGATLLDRRWVATAAHCFRNSRNLRWDRIVIKLGKHDQEREEENEFWTGVADPSSIVVHPAYNRLTFDNDLALVRLRDHAPFTDRVLPACLGDRALGEELLRGGGGSLRTGTVIGWGKLKDNGPSPRFLQEVVLPVVDQKKCLRSTNYTVTRNMFCAGYTQEMMGDACNGDSGGPFLMHHNGRWYLLGVVSWGEGCGTGDKYGFYTRVPNYVSWIRGIMDTEQGLFSF